VAVAGHGVPLVVVHGYGAEGVLYAQTLAGLVDLGFLVVAVDSPGHGTTDAVGPLASLAAYVDLIRLTVAELGIRRAVLAGHSMGGRLVAELAANDEHLPIAVVLVDAIAGDTWDRMNRLFRLAPPALLALGAAMVADTVTTLPVLSDPGQTVRLARLVLPTGAGHVRRPWRLVGPLASIVRAPNSGDALDELRQRGLPVVVVHGERDLPVPVGTGRAAAARAGAELVVVHGARHSWLLRDPHTFPAILAERLDGRLGRAVDEARAVAGLDSGAPPEAVSAAFCEPGAAVLELAGAAPPLPEPGRRGARNARPRRPRYRWTTSYPPSPPASP